MAAYVTFVGAERGAGYSSHDYAIVTEDGGRYEFVYPTATGAAPEMTRLFLEVPMTSRIERDLWPQLDRSSGKDLAVLFLANTTYYVDGPQQYPTWEQARSAAEVAIPRRDEAGK